MRLDTTRGGGTPTAIPEEDLAELPDLGPGFNDTLVWQQEVARLALAGLDI
ncbi:hypothetical protein F4561_005778 [Lipingzhangella halophila]|uniref:Uncharacterized protein n=1 Tax=Lipingzhangella halophila TaxID=1783352 RepID=A0A7W7RMT9_9ACTN|nr:hypothetical protein [Lipingzhangella halophila]MBB4934884.1 hypothetical protein [Lipingzhangella halophila]